MCVCVCVCVPGTRGIYFCCLLGYSITINYAPKVYAFSSEVTQQPRDAVEARM